MKPPFLIGAAVLLSGGWAGAALQRSTTPAPPVRVDLISPEAALRSMVAAMARHDALSAARCIVSPAPEATLRKWEADLRSSKNPFFRHLTITKVKAQLADAEATATVDMTLQLVDGRSGKTQESVKLRKLGAEWKIVPPKREELARTLAAHPREPNILAQLTNALADPQPLLAARSAADERTCKLRVQYLCISASQHADDHEGKYLLTPANWRKALVKYVDMPNAHRCPAHLDLAKDGASYSFNGNLTGITEGKIRDLGRTVLIYEGSGGKLDFRHGGKAMVGFADLGAELVDPQQAAALNWKP